MKILKFLSLSLGFLILTILFFWESLFEGYARNFEKEMLKDNGAPYEAVFILGGNPIARLNEAIKLYKEGKVKKILFTQIKDYNRSFHTILQDESTKLSRVLSKFQIPFEMIKTLSQNGASSTLEEAIDFAYYVQNHQIKEVLLLTDSFHTKRTYGTFSKVLAKQNIKLYVLGISNPYYNEKNWWKSELGLRTYITESGIYLAQFLGITQSIKAH
ncbi:YdcF family protein [Helicobacter pametensis]|uniref:YdcF family protein n=1 Tax=Helicobacter pametensis TaxID=95149 RepID=UPI000488A5ED|nr:YdcF family protein [Helicobacter pametensis]